MKSLFFKLLLLIIVIVVSSDFTFSQFSWTKDPTNPIFSGSGPGTWDKHVNFPNVLFNADSNRYEMWYCGSYGPEISWYPYRIGFAWSNDGIEWTKYGSPVMVPDAGEWDEGSVELGMVLRENGQYKMWYCGMSNDIRQIGYATSPDGITWTKYADNPIISAGSASWEAGGVAWCAIFPNVGSYTMFYSALDISATYWRVGRATSVDGINWQKDSDNNPVITIGEQGQWDDGAVTTGFNCLKINDELYMWYTGWSNEGFNPQIGLVTSTNDGRDWTKYSNNPVLTPGSPGSWDADYVEAGSVMLLGNNTLRIWYDGTRDAVATNLWRIGTATSPLIVPVELSSFTATSNGKEVILNWSTATELNNLVFEVQRSFEGSEFATIGFVYGKGTTTERQDYTYSDKILADGKYYYRLKQIDYLGSYEYSNIIELELKVFNSYLLEQNYPNPFNPTTTIGFGIQNKSNVKITILNSIGEEIAVVLNEEREAGFHQVEFKAVNLPSGVYFYQLKAGNFIETKKMLLLK